MAETLKEKIDRLRSLEDMIEPKGPWKAHTRKQRQEIRNLKREIATYKCPWHLTVVSGYVAWFDWAEEQNKKGIDQTQCPDCLLFFFPEEMGVKPE